jgi:hypothetical protein
VNLATAPERPRPADYGARGSVAPTWRSEGALAWFLGAVFLVLGGNAVVSSRLFADTYYDLYDGRYIISHGIPDRNVATVVSRGAAWVDQQWLAHVVFYGAWSVGGYPAVALLSAVLVTGGFAVLALLMLHRGVPPPRMFAWTLLAFAVCLGNTVVRAQSFGYLFFALTLWFMVTDDDAPRLRRRTWLVVPVLVVWANAHGSVLLGAGLVTGYSLYQILRAGKRRDKKAIAAYLALGLCAAGSIACTPDGLAVLGYYRDLIDNPVLAKYVMEWARPSVAYPLSWAFFAVLALIAISVAVAWRGGAAPDPLLAVVALALLCAALAAVRNQAWFGLGGTLLAADSLARSGPAQVSAFGPRFRQAVAGTLGAFAAACLLYLAVTPQQVFTTGVPVRALDVAASMAAKNPRVKIIGDDWSSTAMLWLHPGMLGRVGFDIQEELYNGTELTAYFDFLLVDGAHWQRVTSGFDVIVVSRLKYPVLSAALEKLPGWRVAYSDRAGLVLIRRHGIG